MRVWECKIVLPEDDLPDGFDTPPRRAAIRAIEEAGFKVVTCFSGWGGSLNETQTELYVKDLKRIAEE